MVHWVLRHGEAGPAPDDARRPLTPRGRSAVERLAHQAAAGGLVVAEIRHSGLLRARHTAEIMAAGPGTGARVVEDPSLSPEAPWEPAAHLLETSARPLLLVGHLPHLARLVGALTLGSEEPEPIRLVPATLVGLLREAGRWQVVAVLTPSLPDSTPSG